MRTAILGAILVFVAGAYYGEYYAGPEGLFSTRLFQFLSIANPTNPIEGEPSQGNSVLTVPAERMRDALHQTYRLKPDARFFLAVSEIYRFLSGQEPKDVTAEFSEDHWVLRHGGIEVGTLPEFPDFPDALGVLTNWAQQLHERFPTCLVERSGSSQEFLQQIKHSVEALWCSKSWKQVSAAITSQELDRLDERLTQFFFPDVALALRDMNEAWRRGVHHPRLLQQGTHAFVLLNLQALDRIETADIVPAKALAFLAITKALTTIAVHHDEALLAEAMDYAAHAQKVAHGLPETDPARLFVMGRDRPLMQLARDQQDDNETKYLALLRLARTRNLEAYGAGLRILFPQDWYSLPVLKAGLDVRNFGTSPALADALPKIILLSLAQEVGMPSLSEITRKVKNKAFTDEEVRELITSLDAILRSNSTTLFDSFESGLPIWTAATRALFSTPRRTKPTIKVTSFLPTTF